MYEAEPSNVTENMEAELLNVAENPDMDPNVTDTTETGTKLKDLLATYEILKDKMDVMQAEKQELRENISTLMKDNSLNYSEVPVPSGRAYKVTMTTRATETVTKEGKSFIKVHATPELLDSLIKTTEKEVLAIRELSGVPRQALFNRMNIDD